MDILLPDRRLRIFLVVVLLASVTLGAVSLSLFDAWLAKLARLPPEAALRELRSAFLWLAGIGSAALGALAAYLWRLGSRARTVRLFPLPGSRLFRDTAVLHGGAAVRRGIVIQALGVALALCGAAFLFFCWRLYFMLAPPAV
jgi:hypothetical protein